MIPLHALPRFCSPLLLNRGVVVTEAGSYSRLIDSCITQLKAPGPFRTCNESKEEEEAASAAVGVEDGLFIILDRIVFVIFCVWLGV